MMRGAIALVAVFASMVGAQGPARPPRDAAGMRREAVTLLQGVDTTAFLDPVRVRLVSGALSAIRRKLPELADIPVGPEQGTMLILFGSDSAPDVFLERSGARRPRAGESPFWSVLIPRVGVQSIDSLNRVFDVAKIQLQPALHPERITLLFRRPMNIPILARSYGRVPEVALATSPFDDVDGSWIVLIAKEGLLHFVFSRGGGDCPAGCINWDRYYVTFDTRDRSVVLAHQVKSGTKMSEPIFYWDVPTRYSINQYATIDNLYSSLQDERWWHRQHAIHVIARLLSDATGPWFGAGEQSPAHFTGLKTAALSRRRESFEALIERLSDPDSDVAALALSYLRSLSAREYSSDAIGIAQWRQWLMQS